MGMVRAAGGQDIWEKPPAPSPRTVNQNRGLSRIYMGGYPCGFPPKHRSFVKPSCLGPQELILGEVAPEWSGGSNSEARIVCFLLQCHLGDIRAGSRPFINPYKSVRIDTDPYYVERHFMYHLYHLVAIPHMSVTP